MRTMATIDAFGFTMQSYGHMLAEAAEARELGNWEQAHRANQKAEEYRLKAQTIRKQIKTDMDRNRDNSDKAA